MAGEGHSIMVADLLSDENIESLVSGLPALNGVVYSVGISKILPAGFLTRENIRESFDSNFTSVVLLNERLLRMKKLLRDKCSVVWISSISTKYPFIGGGLYVSSKAAIEGYSRVFAAEMAKKGIATIRNRQTGGCCQYCFVLSE